MKLYKLPSDILVEAAGSYYLLPATDWDRLVNQQGLHAKMQEMLTPLRPIAYAHDQLLQDALAPIGRQEVWASGVTYYRSRVARMEEAKDAGGGDFYDRVYDADRPELFFKAQPYRTVGSGAAVRIRRDSTWNVPEPELTLFVCSQGSIEGYTIGNDMSSRSIEGENPLYLPQAKSYTGSTALGPCLYVPEQPLPATTTIQLHISRQGKEVFSDAIDLTQMKRKPEELVSYLFREMDFPHGCFLMTGTGIVPPGSFTLQGGDEIRIQIDGIGQLLNTVAPA